ENFQRTLFGALRSISLHFIKKELDLSHLVGMGSGEYVSRLETIDISYVLDFFVSLFHPQASGFVGICVHELGPQVRCDLEFDSTHPNLRAGSGVLQGIEVVQRKLHELAAWQPHRKSRRTHG